MKTVDQKIQESLTGFFTQNVVRKEWPSEQDCSSSLSPFGLAFISKHPGIRVVEYRLENMAAESSRPGDTEEATDSLAFVVAKVWEDKFRDAVVANVEDRVVVNHDFSVNEFVPGLEVVYLDDSPRRDLFGRLVQPFKRVCGSGGTCLSIGKKWEWLPYQVLCFHPDTVHFLFPDLENWIGSISWIENPYEPNGYYRIVMQVAAKPVRTDLGRVITVLPKGLRGLLYRVMWKLLRIKP